MNYLKLNEKEIVYGYLLLEPKIIEPQINKCIAIIKEYRITKIFWFESQRIYTYDWEIEALIHSESNCNHYKMTFMLGSEFEKLLNDKEISSFLDKIKELE